MGEAAAPADVMPRIAAFLARVGISLRAEAIEGEQFLPGIAVRDGGLVYDPAKMRYPGDLLHEAGHIAATDPALRPFMSNPTDDPGEEMAAIAWSWAAVVEIGLAPEILFHEGGYGGGGERFIENFSNGGTVGVPLLAYWGMTAEVRGAREDGGAPYPHMRRWLR